MELNVPGLVLDLIFLALLLWAAVRGARQGLVSGLLRLAGSVAGIIGGVWATRAWALPLYQNYIGVAAGERLTAALADYGDDLTAALQSLAFLPHSVYEMLENILLTATGDAVPQLVNALEPVILPLVQALLFIVVCVVVRLLMRLLVRLFRHLNDVPLLGDVNKALGFAFGTVAGILDCWLLSVGLWLAAAATGGSAPWLTVDTLSLSAVYRLLAHVNPFAG